MIKAVTGRRIINISGIEDRVLKMYAHGMSMRDISQTIEDLYGFKMSAEQISLITDRVVEQAKEWQNRPLKPFYTFLFIDCLYVNVRIDGESKSRAVYVILGYDSDGRKEILGLWMSDTEGKHYWMWCVRILRVSIGQNMDRICPFRTGKGSSIYGHFL